MKENLGVDLGNVIIDHMGFGTTPEFFKTGDYDIIPAVQGVFNALRRLNQERFDENIFVVYNASDIADPKIASWLKSHDFYNRTGIAYDRVRRTQNGRNKLSVCKYYGATHFIDDRLEVLGHLINHVENLYLFRPQQSEIEQYQRSLKSVQRVETWNEILQLIIR